MEWNIGKNAKKCLSCDRGFIENDEFFSALLDKGDAFIREDFCPDCWDQSDKETVYSFWRSKVAGGKEPPKTKINIDVIFDLFIKLEDAGDEEMSKLNLRFVLALYLMRKKILKLKSTKVVENSEILIFKAPDGKSDFELLNPNLDADQIEQITNEVKMLFDTPGLTIVD